MMKEIKHSESGSGLLLLLLPVFIVIGGKSRCCMTQQNTPKLLDEKCKKNL